MPGLSKSSKSEMITSRAEFVTETSEYRSVGQNSDNRSTSRSDFRVQNFRLELRVKVYMQV